MSDKSDTPRTDHATVASVVLTARNDGRDAEAAMILALAEERGSARTCAKMLDRLLDKRERELAAAKAERDALLKDMQHWAEYWNGNENERAMADALHHILGQIRANIDAARAK